VYGDGAYFTDSPILGKTTPCAGLSVTISAFDQSPEKKPDFPHIPGVVMTLVRNPTVTSETTIEQIKTRIRNKKDRPVKTATISGMPVLLICNSSTSPEVEFIHKGFNYSFLGNMPEQHIRAELATLRFL
jgi:hypothetical protein